MCLPSNGMWLGRAGLVPQATRMYSARRMREPSARRDFDFVRTDEPGLPANRVDAVALQLILHDVHFVLRHLLELAAQLAHRHLPFAAVGVRVNLALAVTGQVQDGLAHRFGRNRAGVQADAAHRVGATLDDRHALVQLGGGNRPLSGRQVRFQSPAGRIS